MVDKSKRFELIHEIMSTRGNILVFRDRVIINGFVQKMFVEKRRRKIELILNLYLKRLNTADTIKEYVESTCICCTEIRR